MKVKVKSLSHVRLSDPTDCRLPGSSVHGIFQAKSTGVGCHCLLPDPGIEPGSPTFQADALTSEPPGKSHQVITSWQIDGETMETVTDFIFLGSKITADGDCNHEIKRCLLLGRKAMTNLDSVLKIRDVTLPTKVRLVKAKVHLVKAMVFPVVMYGCEIWT